MTKINLEDLLKEVKELKAQQIAYGNFFDDLKSEIKDLKDTVKNQGEEISKLKKENNCIKEELKYNSTILLDIENEKNNDCLEIIGIPDNNNDLTNVVKIIHEKADVSFDDKNVKKTYRNKTGPTGSKNITIKMINNDLRNTIIGNLKKSKTRLNLKDFDQNLESKPIYLNEKLPFRTKKLFNEVKALQKELHIKFIWVKNSKILARKSESSKIKNINTIDDILNVPTQ